ncbi:MAG: hypothetical protein C4288_15930 [Leptolyngbya sp. ERB_1_1]
MPHAQQQQVLNRLARIKGHIEGIQGMLKAERPCPQVVCNQRNIPKSAQKPMRLGLSGASARKRVTRFERATFTLAR